MTRGVRRSRLALVALVVPALVGCRAGTQGSPSAQPSRSPATASAVASASTIPIDPTPGPTPILPTLAGWQVVNLEIDDGYAYSVTESEKGWVAVGTGPNGPGPIRIWFSDDGVSWSQVADMPEQYGSVYDVMVGGPGFVAFGNDALVDFGAPFAWTSSDGRHWVESDLNSARASGLVRGATQLDGQLLAGGGLMGYEGPDHGPPVMWRSTDGASWTQTVLDADGVEGADALAPVAFGGKLVTLGSGYIPPVGRVWQSSDGVAWQLQPDDPIWVNAHLQDLGVIGDSLVVVGGVWEEVLYTGRPAIWTSDDGQSWTRSYFGPCCAGIGWIMAYGSGALAFSDTVVYSSGNGLTWDLAGTIAGFHGHISKVVNTLTYGEVAFSVGPDGAVLLVPPTP